MKALLSNFLRTAVLCLVALLAGLGQTRAAAPMFRAAYSFTNSWAELQGFNNAGDVLASRWDNPQKNYGILRNNGTVEALLTPVSDALVKSASATAMSQRREDGHVFVTGTADCTDNYTRACVWDVAPDGTYVFTLARLTAQPPDSQLPNTKVSSFGTAVNKAGVVAGGGDSLALASLPTRWAPPYDAPQRFALSKYTAANFVDIDDNGNMLANYVEFDRGTTNEHFSAALVSASGNVTEVPQLVSGFEWPPASGLPTYSTATKVWGEWVVGSGALSNRTTAFAWKTGTPNAVALPNSEFMTSWGSSWAWSVNTSAQILGGGGSIPGVDGLTLWQYENDNFVAYTPWRLIPADSYYPGAVSSALLNDAGEIAMVYQERLDVSTFRTILRVYKPVSDGVVLFYDPIGAAVETYGSVEFTVLLARAEGNNGRVTVNYRTVDETAKAGINYAPAEGMLTWEPGDSEEKKIKVALINNVEFDESKTFHLELTSPSGAQLSQTTMATRYFDELDPYVAAQNIVYAPQDGGFQSGVAARQGSTEAIVRLERLIGLDGKVTVTNFTTTSDSANEGVDFTIPPGLSATWEPGEGGVKTISIPLLAHPDVSTNRLFMVSADVQVEGAPGRPDNVRFGVLILPQSSQALLVSRQPTLVNGKLRLETLGVQGTTIELLKAPTTEGPWTVAAETTAVDGAFTFETNVNTNEKAEFFQFRQKP